MAGKIQSGRTSDLARPCLWKRRRADLVADGKDLSWRSGRGPFPICLSFPCRCARSPAHDARVVCLVRRVGSARCAWLALAAASSRCPVPDLSRCFFVGSRRSQCASRQIPDTAEEHAGYFPAPLPDRRPASSSTSRAPEWQTQRPETRLAKTERREFHAPFSARLLRHSPGLAERDARPSRYWKKRSGPNLFLCERAALSTPGTGKRAAAWLPASESSSPSRTLAPNSNWCGSASGRPGRRRPGSSSAWPAFWPWRPLAPRAGASHRSSDSRPSGWRRALVTKPEPSTPSSIGYQ